MSLFFFHYIKWAIIHYCDYLMVSSNYLQFNQWEAIQVECSHPVSVCHCCLSSSFLGSTGCAGLTFQFVSLQLIPVLRENMIEIQSGLYLLPYPFLRSSQWMQLGNCSKHLIYKCILTSVCLSFSVSWKQGFSHSSTSHFWIILRIWKIPLE